MTLLEVETAAQSLPREQQEELLRFIATVLRLPSAQHPADLSGMPAAITPFSEVSPLRQARLLHRNGDTFLEAPADAPAMTPELVRQLLEESV